MTKRLAGPLFGLSRPVAPRTKAPASYAEASSVSQAGQRSTSVQIPQSPSADATVSAVFSNLTRYLLQRFAAVADTSR